MPKLGGKASEWLRMYAGDAICFSVGFYLGVSQSRFENSGIETLLEGLAFSATIGLNRYMVSGSLEKAVFHSAAPLYFGIIAGYTIGELAKR